MRDQEALFHVPCHAQELLHRHAEGQRLFRNTGPGGHVEHPEHRPRPLRPVLQEGILHDGAAARGEGAEDPVRFAFVEVGEGKEAGENIRGCEKDDGSRVVLFTKFVEALEHDEPGGSSELRRDPDHLPDELRGLLVPLALELARQAAGKEIFEGRADLALEPRVPPAARAPDRIHVKAKRTSLPHPGQHPDHAHVRGRHGNALAAVFRVGVIEGQRQLGAAEVLCP